MSDKHEGLCKIIDIEPDASAQVLDFHAQPLPWLRGRRYEISFQTITAERFRKSEQTLWPYGASHPIPTHPHRTARVHGSLRRRNFVAELTEKLAQDLRKALEGRLGLGRFNSTEALEMAMRRVIADAKLPVGDIRIESLVTYGHETTVHCQITALPGARYVQVSFKL